MVDTLSNQITLPTTLLVKMSAVLTKLVPSLCRASWWCWYLLFGITQIIYPALLVKGDLFWNLKHALYQGIYRLCLTSATHVNLRYWCDLIMNHTVCNTHLLEVAPPAPLWHGTHESCQLGMGGWFLMGGGASTLASGVFPYPALPRHIWTFRRWSYNGGFELAASMTQVTIMVSHIPLMSAYRNVFDTNMSIVWKNHQFTSVLAVAINLLHACAFTLKEHLVTTTRIY